MAGIPAFVDQPAFVLQWNDASFGGAALSPAPHSYGPGAIHMARLKLTDSLNVGDIVFVIVARYRQQLMQIQVSDSSNTTFNTNDPTDHNLWKVDTRHLENDNLGSSNNPTDIANVIRVTITDRLIGTADGGTAFIDLHWGNGGLFNNRLYGAFKILRFSGKLKPIPSFSDLALLSLGQGGNDRLNDPHAGITQWNALNDIGGYNPHGYSNIYPHLQVGGVIVSSYWSFADQSAGITPAIPTVTDILAEYSDDPTAAHAAWTLLGPMALIADPLDTSNAAPPPANFYVFYRIRPAGELFNVYGHVSTSPAVNDWGASVVGYRYVAGDKIDTDTDKSGTRFTTGINATGQAIIYIDNSKTTATTSALTPVIVDSALTCSFPSVHISKRGNILYIYQKDSTAYARTSDDSGRTWSAAVAIAPAGYTTPDVKWSPGHQFAIATVFNQSNSTWYIVTGTYDTSIPPVIVWNTPVSTTIVGQEIGASLYIRKDGVYEFSYVDNAGAIQIKRCRKLSSLGVGAWV